MRDKAGETSGNLTWSRPRGRTHANAHAPDARTPLGAQHEAYNEEGSPRGQHDAAAFAEANPRAAWRRARSAHDDFVAIL